MSVVAPILRAIDNGIITAAARYIGKCPEVPPRVEEAARLLGRADFFKAVETTPRLWPLEDGTFEFASEMPTQARECEKVRGRIFHPQSDWRSAPTVILVHGWNDEIGYRFRFPWLARELQKKGIGSAAVMLPYHLERRPKSSAVRDFISSDVFRTIEAARQAVGDIRSLVKGLKAAGCPKVALWAVSLGGWVSGHVICHETAVDAAVLATPIARMDLAIQALPFCQPLHRSLTRSPLDLERLNLRHCQPLIPRENVLIQVANHDLFSPPEPLEELGQAWNQPEIWRTNDGHISAMVSPTLVRNTVEWIRQRIAG